MFTFLKSMLRAVQRNTCVKSVKFEIRENDDWDKPEFGQKKKKKKLECGAYKAPEGYFDVLISASENL